MSLAQVIYYTSILSPVFVLIAGRRQRNTLWLYAMVCLLADLVSFSLSHAHLPHSIVSNSFLLLEFILIARYFSQSLWGNKFHVFTIGAAFIVSALYAIHTYGVYQTAATDSLAYNYTFGAYFYLSYIIFCLLSLFNILRKAEEVYLGRSPEFFVAVGILIYASAAFLLLVFKNLLEQEHKQLLYNYWGALFQPANIIKNIFIAIGVYNAYKRTT